MCQEMSEVELAIGRLKSHKSPGIVQIPSELIKAGVEQFAWRFINLLPLYCFLSVQYLNYISVFQLIALN